MLKFKQVAIVLVVTTPVFCLINLIAGFYATTQDKAKYAALQRLEFDHRRSNGDFTYIQDALTGFNVVSLPFATKKNGVGEWLIVNSPCSDGRPCILSESLAYLNCEALKLYVKRHAFDQASKNYIRMRCKWSVSPLHT